jgi:predicted SAM-dependent methyltransferase
MALLNYTTTIEALKTANEVSSILVDHGAKSILTEYKGSEVVALSFEILTAHGTLGIRLPVDADATLRVLEKQWRQGKVPRRFVNREQAVRIAWRIIKDWVEAQMAIIDTEMVKMEEVFLPYMIMPTGKTLYEVIEEKKFYLTEGGSL